MKLEIGRDRLGRPDWPYADFCQSSKKLLHLVENG